MCKFQRGTIECRGDGYCWDADWGGYDPTDHSLPCPSCNTLGWLKQHKEEAETCVTFSGPQGSGTGVDIWKQAVEVARAENPEQVDVLLASIGSVAALYKGATGEAAVRLFTYPLQESVPQDDLSKGFTSDSWGRFVARLHHDCDGEGVAEHHTADVLFIVEACRTFYGVDREYTPQWAVVCDDRRWKSLPAYWCGLSKAEQEELSKVARAQLGKPFPELTEDQQWWILDGVDHVSVLGFVENWDYVSCHFTMAAAEAYVAKRKGAYPEGLRIIADAQSYCHEFNAVKKAILSGSLVFKNRLVED